MSKMSEMGPVEWGIVVAHRRWGLEVRLEGSDRLATLDSGLIHDSIICCNEEYWPDIGQRIQVRTLPHSSPVGKIRLAARGGLLEGTLDRLAPKNSIPPGMGPTEWGTVVAHHDWGMEVRLEASGTVGELKASLVSDDVALCARNYWPNVGERIPVKRLGVGPDGHLRLTHRKSFLSLPIPLPYLNPLAQEIAQDAESGKFHPREHAKG